MKNSLFFIFDAVLQLDLDQDVYWTIQKPLNALIKTKVVSWADSV